MTPLRKYIWLIDTIRRHGEISHKDLSDEWERNKDMSDYKPLHRGTFNRWRDAIRSSLGVDIECRSASGGYVYYIANPEVIDESKLKRWMLDTFAVGNIVEENLALKNRILVDEVPSGRLYLTAIMDAMKRNKVVEITYGSFRTGKIHTASVEPYCLKLFEGRWYMLARPAAEEAPVLFGLDRIESLTVLDETFRLPPDFSAAEYFNRIYGIVAENVAPQRIVIRAYRQHRHYVMSLPIHHSQRLIEDHGDYADFELFLAPTFDFVMRLLHDGAWLEVMSPVSLRQAMKGWISDMYDLYADD
ncbi:MAG: WYL domain-containing protein [Muribaculaceae bacterium]|nr:WYL domain-containing protein [Muribaculaceae bacterium]